MAKMGAVASASVCALVGGVVLAQYIFTMKKKTGKKTKIIEMVRGKRPRASRPADARPSPCPSSPAPAAPHGRPRGARRISRGDIWRGRRGTLSSVWDFCTDRSWRQKQLFPLSVTH